MAAVAAGIDQIALTLYTMLAAAAGARPLHEQGRGIGRLRRTKMPESRTPMST